MQDILVGHDHHGRADRDPGKDVEEEQFHRMPFLHVSVQLRARGKSGVPYHSP